MKKLLSIFMALAVFALAASPAFAETTNQVVTPTSPVFDANNVVGVLGDSATGFPSGSIASDGSGKTDMYFTPESLFGRQVTLGEVSKISYWTKKNTTHVVNPADWFLTIYTKPYSGDVSTATWYGDRIGTEPYFSVNLNAPANTWNNWTTDGSSNQLRFFESTQGAPGATFGSYTDSDWATFVAGNALSSNPYASHAILSFSVQTGSAWADGFTGQVDGLTITLTDNSVANINFELTVPDATAPKVPTNGLPNASFLNTNVFDFTWNVSTDDVGPVTYEYQSSLNSAEVGGVLTTNLWKSEILPTAMIHSSGASDGQWYWQVRAKDAANNYSAWSQIWSVTLDTIAPAVPTLVNPLDNSTVNVHDFIFDWNNVSDATPVTYIWQSSYNSAFSSVLVQHTGLTDSFVNSPGTPDGVYYWRVLTRDAAGNVSPWSTVWKVTVDTSTPVLVGPPTDKDQCKKDGWKKFNNPTFKNQGQCVSYVVSNEKAGKKN